MFLLSIRLKRWIWFLAGQHWLSVLHWTANMQNFTQDSILDLYKWSILVTVTSMLHSVFLGTLAHTTPSNQKDDRKFTVFMFATGCTLCSMKDWWFCLFFFYYYFKINDEQVTPAEPELQRLSLVKRSKSSLVIQ